MRKLKKFIAILLSVSIFTGTLNISAFASEEDVCTIEQPVEAGNIGWDGITTEDVYETENYKIVFSLKDYWNNGYNASVKIENTGDEVIQNWYLCYDSNYEIANIWNAEIHDDKEGLCIIKNAGWNQDIPVGHSVEYGFTGIGEFSGFPTKYEIVTQCMQSVLDAYSVEYVLNSDWGSGFSGSIIITNNSENVLEDWVLEFNFDRKINNIWNGVIEDNNENHYIVRNSGYNSNIPAGESISIGFTGDSGVKEYEPFDYKLYTYELSTSEYIELADGKIDKAYLETAIYPRLLLDGLPIEDVRLADDFDGDGVTLIEEYELDTNPFSADTDEDGLNDYDEVHVYGTNPINFDTDSDNMSDGTEISSGLNPLINDSDYDEILDNEEIIVQQVRLDSVEKYTIDEVGTLPSVELTGAGDYSQEIYATAIKHDESILDITALVGTAYDFVHEDELDFESGKLTFTISDDILEQYVLDDLAIAWYNEEENALELLETTYNTENNTISADVSHFSIYMVVSSSEYFYNLDRSSIDSIVKSGKADVVFVIDTTGSMGTEISNVRNNIESFVSTLEDNNVDIRLGLVEYKDIYADGVNSTKSYNWYTDVSDFKAQLSVLGITGGGDTPESVVDALNCARKMKYRTGVGKYIILLTDADYKNGIATDSGATLDEEIEKLVANKFSVSVVTNTIYFDEYSSLVDETDGVLADINKNFSNTFLPIILKIGVQTNSGCWVRLANGSVVKLDKDPSLGDETIDTDKDGIPDVIELKSEFTLQTYNGITNSIEKIETWAFYSNPAKADTDGDSLCDVDDLLPTKYDTVITYNDESVVEFNTGNSWYILDCPVYDSEKSSFILYNKNDGTPVSLEEMEEINRNALKNDEQDFSIEELTIIGLLNTDGSKMYMKHESGVVR